MSAYRLLRNNKENGPFTLDQLIAMGLKAYDLVWVDGKSAAWRYPSEIPELAAHAPAVEEQPFDRFYRRQSVPAKAAKPRFRIKADWRKVDDTPAAAPVTGTAAMPTATESVTVVQTTEKVQSLPPVLPAAAASAAQSDTRAIPETRYSESLDSIKQRYSNTVLQRNSTPKGNILRYAAVVGLFPVLAAGIWIGTSWSNRNKLEAVPEETAATATVTETPQAPPPTTTPAEETTPQLPQAEAPAPIHTIERSVAPSNGHTDVQPRQTPPQQIVVKNETKPAQPSKNNLHIIPAGSGNNPLIRTVASRTTVMPAAGTIASRPAAEDKKPSVTQPLLPAPSQAYETTPTGKNNINDYVAVKEEYEQVDETSRQIKLHIHNKSNIPLDLVVLDLQYYDANGRFKKGETLYVNNLSAHNEVALDAPAAKNNQRVNYKVSLLSIEKKGIYLIAE